MGVGTTGGGGGLGSKDGTVLEVGQMGQFGGELEGPAHGHLGRERGDTPPDGTNEVGAHRGPMAETVNEARRCQLLGNSHLGSKRAQDQMGVLQCSIEYCIPESLHTGVCSTLQNSGLCTNMKLNITRNKFQCLPWLCLVL